MSRGRKAPPRLGLAIACSLLASCHAKQPEAPQPTSPLASATHQGEVRSNILRADYAGSATCGGCHEKQHAAWLDSPMHRMTRDLQRTQINAPFSGNTFDFRADSLRLEKLDEQRFMRLLGASKGKRDTLFRVTKVIGGRYREDFVGVEVDPDSPFAIQARLAAGHFYEGNGSG